MSPSEPSDPIEMPYRAVCVNDRHEEAFAAEARAHAMRASVVAVLVLTALAVACALGASLAAQSAFYATTPLILIAALVVLALQDQLLNPPVNANSRIAVMMVEHGSALFVRWVLILPMLAIAFSCVALAYERPPRAVAAISTILSFSSLGSVMTFVGSRALGTSGRPRNSD